MTSPKLDRVHKIIAQAGVMSRRKAEEAILAGRVHVNGELWTELGKSIDPAQDRVTVDGNLVELKSEKKTYIFYKPRGVITSKGDPQGRPTVMDFFKDDPTLNPVGRLDFESEGLLLLTHDGELALKLTHPRYEVKKIYEVEVLGAIPPGFFEQVLKSVPLEDGDGKFDQIVEREANDSASGEQFVGTGERFVGTGEGDCSTHFLVTVSEGRNRFIRRMFSHFGLTVKKLKRIKLGEYELGSMKPGDRREVESGR